MPKKAGPPKLSFWQKVRVTASSFWRLVVLRKEN